MTVLVLQTLLLLLIAFVIGCLIGCLLRQAIAGAEGIPEPVRKVSEARARAAAQRVEPTPKPTSPEPVAAVRQRVSVQPYRTMWRADVTDDGVVLSGAVATVSARDAVLSSARATFGNAQIRDDMSVMSGDTTATVDRCVAALDMLTRLSTGRVGIEDDVVSLSGVVAGYEALARIETDMRADLPHGLRLGTLDLNLAPGDTGSDGTISQVPTAEEEGVVSETSETLEPETVQETDLAREGSVQPPDGAANKDDANKATESEADEVAEPAEPIASAALLPTPIPVDVPDGLTGRQPAGYETPRGGVADDLKRIKGIGKVNEGKLNRLGIWHFDQIAAWTANEIAWVDGFLVFKGRIEREDWVAQATDLAMGSDTSDQDEGI